jgi:hypothetical protein
MADSSKTQSAGQRLLKWLVLILLTSVCGLGIALFFMAQPQDLTDIAGYGPPLKTTPARNLKTVLQNAIDRGYPITLTETEINQWLGRTLVAKQGGLLAGNVSLERVWVRLEDGRAEVVMARNIIGRSFTISMFLKVEQSQGPNGTLTEVRLHGGPYLACLPQPPRGGRFGKLVVPQGFLLLVMPAYENLASLFREELHLAFEEMARIKIERHRLVLDPREAPDNPAGLPYTF